MKKLLLLLIILPMLSRAQFTAGITVGNASLLKYKTMGTYSNYIDGLSPVVGLNVGYKILFILEPTITYHYNTLNLKGDYKTISSNFFVGARGSFIKFKVSPFYHFAFGYNMARLLNTGQYLPNYNHNSNNTISLLALGLKANVVKSFRVELLFAYYMTSQDDPAAAGTTNNKYNYFVPTIGATYIFKKKII